MTSDVTKADREAAQGYLDDPLHAIDRRGPRYLMECAFARHRLAALANNADLEPLRDMREIAVDYMGYESLLEALEDLDRLRARAEREPSEAFSRSTDPAPDVFDEWVPPATEPIDVAELAQLKRGLSAIRQYRSTIMVRFDGKMDWEQWRELNQALDDLAAGEALLAKHGER